MDILDRLRKIERLEQEDAPPGVLLEEVRALLVEAEVWVRSEARANERAVTAVENVRTALARGEESVPGAERTLVA
jgi:hypothetical protein